MRFHSRDEVTRGRRADILAFPTGIVEASGCADAGDPAGRPIVASNLEPFRNGPADQPEGTLVLQISRRIVSIARSAFDSEPDYPSSKSQGMRICATPCRRELDARLTRPPMRRRAGVGRIIVSTHPAGQEN